MISAGIPEEIIGDIAVALDQVAIARHRLHEESVREGWLDTDRYIEALKALPDGLDVIRSSFGEDIYDRYLYATHAPNRMQAGPATGSQTVETGLRQDDLVISINGQRIYGVDDLTSAIETDGDAPVELAIQRSTELITRRLTPSVLLRTPWLNVCVNPNHA